MRRRATTCNIFHPLNSSSDDQKKHPHRDLSTALRFGRDDKGEGAVTFSEVWRLGWTGLRAVTPRRLQIPPLRCAPVGMTRGERLLFGRSATWMEGVRSGYSTATADPCASLCRKSSCNLQPEWVAQVSLLRPGFLLRNRSYRKLPALIAGIPQASPQA
jgi:hypothetical protein